MNKYILPIVNAVAILSISSSTFAYDQADEYDSTTPNTQRQIQLAASEGFSLRNIFFGSSNQRAHNNHRANNRNRNQYRNQRYQNRRNSQQRSRRAYQNSRGYNNQQIDDRYNESYVVEYYDGSGRVYREVHHSRPNDNYQRRNRETEYRQEYYDPSEYRYEPPRTHRKSVASSKRYNDKLCKSGKYDCIKIKSGDKWSKLFPDEHQRDLVKRFNRTNMKLRIGSHYAIPDDIKNASLVDIAPLDKKINNSGKKLIIVNLPKLAFGAYDESGNLVYWGPVSGGRDWCGDIGKPCNTITGAFEIFNKKGQDCRSRSFPVDRGGGAPMPYCMFFHTGFALHGSHEVPGYNASHGCVRMYTKDAKWLNEQFIDVPLDENDSGTEVVVLTDETNGEELTPSVTQEAAYDAESYSGTQEAAYDAENYDDSAFQRSEIYEARSIDRHY